MSATKKDRKRTAYEKHFDIHKTLMLWVPPSVEQAYFDDPDSPTIMNVVYLIEAAGVQRINTAKYGESFQNFYNLHLYEYTTSETNFCSKYSEGGVSPEYIVNSADCEYDDNNITLISLELDKKGAIKDVYGLITFHLLEHDPETIMVETLCGNRTLPPSGEGTRLMNFLKRRAYEVGIIKIALHPLDNVIGYYTRLNFRKLHSDEADAVNLSDYEDDDTTMATNMRARKNWNKLRTTVKVLGTFMRNKKLKDTKKTQKVIKEIYKGKYDEKTGKRGTLIHEPFTQPTTHFVPQPTRVGKVTDVKIGKDGTVEVRKLATPIIKGASIQLIKERDAILTAAQMTKLRNEAAQKKVSPINEESSEEEALTESQIKELEKQFKLEEEKKGFTIFQNAKKTAKGTRKRKLKRRV